MASNHFTISPTGGTGNGTVVVTPTSVNNTQSDKIAIVTISNGGSPVNVTVNHWGMPSIAVVSGGTEPITAPASGTTLKCLVKTHYQVQFRNKPDWITIDDGQGNYISSGTVIAANVANGKTYNLTVLPNATNSSRSTSNFGLWHYAGSVLQNSFDELSITQPQGAEDYITVPMGVSIDWDSMDGVVIPVNANVTYTVQHNNPSQFDITGGNGYVSVSAKQLNSGSTSIIDKVEFVSTKASFPYTAVCWVTQYREPTIAYAGNNTIPPTGGSTNISVVSDYYWWIKPTVEPDPNPNIPYITLSGKTSGMNMEPVTVSTDYKLTWTNNTGNIRNDDLYIGYLKQNGSSAVSTSYVSYRQDNEASETLSVVPNRVPSTGYVSSAGGQFVVEVVTGREWHLNSNPTYCTVDPTYGTGNTNVTITVPPSSKSGSYWLTDTIYFSTYAPIAYDTVSVWQYGQYVEPTYVTVTPSTYNAGSGTTQGVSVTVSANTGWQAVVNDDFIDMSITTGTAGSSVVSFDIASNLTSSARTGSITFNSTTDTAVTATLTVNQTAGIDVITTNVASIGPASSAGTAYFPYTLRIKATADWAISRKPSWVTVTPSTGSASTAYTSVSVAFAANTGDSRSDFIQITAGTAMPKLVVVSQNAAAPEPAEDFISITPTASTYTSGETHNGQATVSASTDWRIITKPSWATFRETFSDYTENVTSGTSGSTRLWVSVENNTGDTRSATTVFALEGTALSGNLTITQESGYTPVTYGTLVIDPEDDLTNIDPVGGMFSVLFENDDVNPEYWEINYGGDWAHFYDGPDPSTADEVDRIEPGTVGYIMLKVNPTSSPRTMVISFYGESSSRTITLEIEQGGY